MSRMNRRKALKNGESKSRKKMYKAKKSWVVASATVAIGISTLAFTNTAQAEEWHATTLTELQPRISADSGQHTFQNGDTFWIIGQAINIKPEKLMEWNDFADGSQYTVPIGTTIYWNGDQVKIVDKDGKVVADKTVTNEDRITPKQTESKTESKTDNTTTVDTTANKKSEMYNLTVSYVDEDGNKLVDDNSVSLKRGDKYTATARNIDGYTVKGDTTKEVTIDSNKSIQFVYTKNMAPMESHELTINYVDESGKKIAAADVVKLEKGDIYTATAKTIDGYTIKGDMTQKVILNGDKTIQFVYTKNQTPDKTPMEKYSITVTYVDEHDNKIADSMSFSAVRGETYTATAKNIDGYTVQGDAKQEIIVDSNKTIQFRYTKNETPMESHELTIKYMDENDKEIADADVVKLEKGDTYTATAKTIKGYTVKGDMTQKVMVDDDKTIQFVYTKDETPDKTPMEKYSVNVTFVDENGDTIADRVSSSEARGTTFTATAKNINGYTVKGDATQEIMVDSNKTIQFVYTKNETPMQSHKVTINYVNKEGKPIALSDIALVEEGTNYTATAKKVNGYTVEGDMTQKVMVDDDKTINFVYTKDEMPVEQYDLTVTYVDEAGDHIAKSMNVKLDRGTEYTAEAIKVAGYTIKGDATKEVLIDGNKSVEFTYTKDETPVEKFNVTISYVDDADTKIIADQVVAVDKGDNYTAEAKELAGYTLNDEKMKTVTVTGDTTIQFKYMKNAASIEKYSLTVNYVDEKGNSIVPKTELQLKRGEIFTAEAKEFEGYTLKDEAKKEVIMDGNKSIQFIYTKNEASAEMFDVTVSYVDEKGDNIAPDEVVSVEKGQSYEATAKEINGYTLKSEKTQTVTVDGAKAIKFVYAKNAKPIEEYDVTVSYEDESGESIADSLTLRLKRGTEYTAEAIKIAGYTIKGDATKEVLIDGNKSIKFTYTKDETPAELPIVTINYVDEAGKPVADSETAKVANGDNYTAVAKEVGGYTLKGEKMQTVTVKGDTTIEFVYTKNSVPIEEYDVTVSYVDEAGDPIATGLTLRLKRGTEYTAEAKEIEGYTVTGMTKKEIIVDGNKSIIFTYTKNEAPIEMFGVTINYVDEAGKPVAGSETAKVANGDNYTATAKEVAGYTLKGEKTQTVAVDSDKVINFIYSKDKAQAEEYTLSVSYVDEDKNSLATNTSLSVRRGTEYTVKAADIEGYTVQGDSMRTILMDSNKNIEFVYKKNEEPVKMSTVIVEYVDEADEPIMDSKEESVKNGDSFTADAIMIDGYTLQSPETQTVTVDGDTKIKFVYKKNEVKKDFSLTVTYVDEQTGEPLFTKETMGLNRGETYKVEAKTIPGYEVIGNPVREDIMESNKTIEFVYRKK